MKKFIWIPALALAFTSCGGGDKEKTNENSGDTTETAGVDLRGTYEYVFNANGNDLTLTVPEEYANTGARLDPVDTMTMDGIQWEVMVGDKYHITIEDIEGTDASVANEKKRMENTGIYDLSFMVDEKDAIMYRADLKNGAGQKPFYHVYGIVKVGGKKYSIKSFEQGEFNESQAQKMLTTIKALQNPA